MPFLFRAKEAENTVNTLLEKISSIWLINYWSSQVSLQLHLNMVQHA